MKNLAKNLLKKMGLRFDNLVWPYYWTAYNFLYGKAFNPLKVTIELTYGCNLRCKMCPLENAKDDEKAKFRQQEELTTNDLKNFIDELKRMGVKSIMLTGGEPFIKKDIDEIIAYIKQKGFYCCVLSNGYFITQQHAKALVEAEVDLISFSMDGPQDLHNEIRGVRDSFQKIRESIRIINEQKSLLGKASPRIILNCTISALNQKQVSQIVDIAKDLGVKLVDYMYLFYTDEDKVASTKNVMAVGALKPENQILPDNIKNVDICELVSEVQRAKAKGKDFKIEVGFNPPLRDEEIQQRFYDDKFAFSSKCFYPWFETRLDPYGNIYPCSLDVAMGNIREESFRKIWNDKRYVEFRKKLREFGLLPMCTKCCKLVYRYWSNLPTLGKKNK